MNAPHPGPQRLSIESPYALPWAVGIARVAVLVIGAIGVYKFGELTIAGPGMNRLGAPGWLVLFLLTLYAFNLTSSVLYLLTLKRSRTVSAVLTWTQILLDFSVVCATVSFTGGTSSFFTVLLVVVILEAGLLLGLSQAFTFAFLSTVFVGVQAGLSSDGSDKFSLWYNIFVEGLSFWFAAFISGYWNQRIYRLQEFQREVLDNMNSGFLITDQNGTISAQNRAADEILDIQRGSAVGRNVGKLIRPDSGGECPIITAIRLERDFTSYEFYIVTNTGERKLLGLTTSRLHDRKGNIRGTIASFTDLTEVDMMRRDLRRQDRLAAIGELAAGLAHEIRNPVASIRSAVEELRNSVGRPELTERLVSIAERESDHLNEIVSGFLDFARHPDLKTEQVDLCDLIHETEDVLRRKAGETSEVAVEVRLPDEPCFVYGDPSQLRQVFINLGNNALEAMQKQGRLTITVTRTQPAAYEVWFDDEGPGMTPDEVARVFEPFYTTKEAGVGMGLAICLRIITAHDGVIRAAAREGGGTRMSVQLPIAKGGE